MFLACTTFILGYCQGAKKYIKKWYFYKHLAASIDSTLILDYMSTLQDMTKELYKGKLNEHVFVLVL
jgi:hypothetical protein